MKNEYDFSQGECGKFFNENVKMNLPVYLDDDTMSFVKDIAHKRKTGVSTIVNTISRSDKPLSEAKN